ISSGPQPTKAFTYSQWPCAMASRASGCRRWSMRIPRTRVRLIRCSADPWTRAFQPKSLLADPAYRPAGPRARSKASAPPTRTRIEADPKWRERLQLYVLLAPHLDGAGAGNSARRHYAARKEVLTAWRERTCLALGVSTRFLKTSCGYVGFSDGWQDLKDNF